MTGYTQAVLCNIKEPNTSEKKCCPSQSDLGLKWPQKIFVQLEQCSQIRLLNG